MEAAEAKAEAEESARLEAESETEAKNFKEQAEVVSDTDMSWQQ